ncbi:MAG: GNAT family N-acetyltransferase [Candidatus Omnitrophica bacterium]|nr:GNAT family N-acetyltransferase [Candidatus Omnitrophota bacterium]
MELENVELLMIRPHLAEIPQHQLPPGYLLRTFNDPDIRQWVRIHELADRFNSVTLDTFYNEFGADMGSLKERSFYLDAPDGATIGTATAWYNPSFEGADYGRVHWVAIVPEAQGKGLSRPLLTAVMNCLQANHQRAYLATSSARLAAIRLYLEFGFSPYTNPEFPLEGWRVVKQNFLSAGLAVPPQVESICR